MNKRSYILIVLGIAGILGFFLPFCTFSGFGFGVSGFEAYQEILFPEDGFFIEDILERYQAFMNEKPAEFIIITVLGVFFLLQPLLAVVFSLKFLLQAFRPRNRKYLFELIFGIIMISINLLTFLLINLGMREGGSTAYQTSFLPAAGFYLSAVVFILPRIITARFREQESHEA